MKTNSRPEGDDRLTGVLREWVVQEPLPPGFQDAVWRRVARAQDEAGNPLIRWVDRLVTLYLSRPRVAVSYVTLFLALGIAAGEWAAQSKGTQLQGTLSERYVRSVDPYQSSGPNP